MAVDVADSEGEVRGWTPDKSDVAVELADKEGPVITAVESLLFDVLPRKHAAEESGLVAPDVPTVTVPADVVIMSAL